jgi:hypothetical protein
VLLFCSAVLCCSLQSTIREAKLAAIFWCRCHHSIVCSIITEGVWSLEVSYLEKCSNIKFSYLYRGYV